MTSVVVTRAFAPGPTPWSPGHRGVDLAATPGTAIMASAAGTVTYAGAVVDRSWVTIEHLDGLRTTVGPLGEVAVRRGQQVVRGQVVGRLADDAGHPDLHWSARRGGEYVDPMELLQQRRVPTLVGPGHTVASGLTDLPRWESWDGRDNTLGLLPSTSRADEPGWLTAPNPNHVVSVSGLLTSTGSTAMPLDLLGIPTESMTHLSHAGRATHVGAGRADDPLRDQHPWSAADTFEGVDRAARLLEDQLRAQWARQPGVAVDLVGHSLGGVVVMHYLLAYHDPSDPGLPPISHVVTLAAPLEGADAATAVDLPAGMGILDGLVDLAGLVLGVGMSPETIDDLRVGSPLLRDLADAWVQAQQDPHRSPLASGTRVLTIGGSRDLVVADHRSDLPGAEHVVVPGGHSAMRQTEAVLQVVRAFLEDRDVPAGASGWGAWLSPGISLAEQVVGVAL